MHPIRKQLSKNSIIKALSSIRITVVCLSLLFILTFWGTIDQVANGLYISQARFFNSLVFTFWGFIPFPGARLVLWVLFINLVCVSLTRFVYRWSKAGIVIIHCGLLLFFVAAFVTFHGSSESYISLMEGEETNVSTAYHTWELSLWSQEGDKKQVVAFDADHLKKGDKLNFDPYGVSVIVKAYHQSCEAYGDAEGASSQTILNASGIRSFKPIPLDKEPQKNIPGIAFQLEGTDQDHADVLLYGVEVDPLPITKEGETYYVQLRLRRYPAPFTLRLKDFTMERHPNTDVARSYKSLVEVLSHGASREVLISMNEPLRHKNYTLYQASYSVDKWGREHSTLAVVKNTGRLLPYIATFLTVAGLAVHLLLMAFESKERALRKKK
jgi:hypothetical protein